MRDRVTRLVLALRGPLPRHLTPRHFLQQKFRPCTWNSSKVQAPAGKFQAPCSAPPTPRVFLSEPGQQQHPLPCDNLHLCFPYQAVSIPEGHSALQPRAPFGLQTHRIRLTNTVDRPPLPVSQQRGYRVPQTPASDTGHALAVQ